MHAPICVTCRSVRPFADALVRLRLAFVATSDHFLASSGLGPIVAIVFLEELHTGCQADGQFVGTVDRTLIENGFEALQKNNVESYNPPIQNGSIVAPPQICPAGERWPRPEKL